MARLLSSERSNSDFAVLRYNVDGSLDTSFGGDGMVTIDFANFGDEARGVALDSQGRVLVVGRSYRGARRATTSRWLG